MEDLTSKKIVIELKGNGHPRFYELLKEIGELHDQKNADYSSKEDPLSNFRECKDWNIPLWIGVLNRLSDKWCRVKQAARKYLTGEKIAVKSESVKDTLMDTAVYSLIAIILYEEENK